MAKKNIAERTKMVEAMEYICRQLNNENHFESWLMNGVADGDIKYGDFDWGNPAAQWYAENDDNFAELMQLFLNIMFLILWLVLKIMAACIVMVL